MLYKELVAWQKAYQFNLNIYKATSAFPREELFGLVSQMRRAAASIPANIAEGSMRNSPKEFQQFLRVARGSMAEMEVWIQLSFDLKYINQPAFNDLYCQCDEVGRLLNGMLKSLKNT